MCYTAGHIRNAYTFLYSCRYAHPTFAYSYSSPACSLQRLPAHDLHRYRYVTCGFAVRSTAVPQYSMWLAALTQLVRQYRHHLVLAALPDQRVVQHDAPAPEAVQAGAQPSCRAMPERGGTAHGQQRNAVHRRQAGRQAGKRAPAPHTWPDEHAPPPFPLLAGGPLRLNPKP